MDQGAPSKIIKDLDGQVKQILRPLDMSKQNRPVREAITNLRRDLRDARIYAVDYEVSETRDEQLANAKKARKYLSGASGAILLASQHDIFGAVDVAHMTALIEQVKADLK